MFLRLGAVLVLLAGCATGPPREVDVAGRVLSADGKPVSRLALRFHPWDEANKKGGTLTTPVREGEFVGKCLPGRYKVTAVPIRPAAPGKAPSPDKDTALDVPRAYTSTGSTPWVVKVPSAGKKDIVLTLE